MTTSQRPDGLPPFFHELSSEERQTLSNAAYIEGMLDLVYRLRGVGRDADERDSREGWLIEVHSWFREVQEIGNRVAREHAGDRDVGDRGRSEDEAPHRGLARAGRWPIARRRRG